MIQILALFSLIRSIGNAGGSLVLACGRADLAFYWNLTLFTFIPLTIVAGAKIGGLLGVAWSLLTLQMFLLFVWYYFVVRKLLGDCFSGFIGSMIPPVIFAVLMAGVVTGIAVNVRSTETGCLHLDKNLAFLWLRDRDIFDGNCLNIL